MQLFNGFYFSVAAGSRHLWPTSNSAIVNNTTLWIIFHLLQSEV